MNNYTLSEISFIGGSTQYLTYNVFDVNGTPIDLNGAICQMKLRQYGNFGDSAILTKTGNLLQNSFQVVLDSNDTVNLFGKYVQQAIVIDFGGKEFRFQGFVIIDKSIN